MFNNLTNLHANELKKIKGQGLSKPAIKAAFLLYVLTHKLWKPIRDHHFHSKFIFALDLEVCLTGTEEEIHEVKALCVEQALNNPNIAHAIDKMTCCEYQEWYRIYIERNGKLARKAKYVQSEVISHAKSPKKVKQPLKRYEEQLSLL